jgi:CheY-like chemotaxis protein
VEALARLEQVRRPCLILLDLMMPGMDGFEFLRELKEQERTDEFPVLVLSAHAANLATAESYQGVLGALRKPFEVSKLLSFVDAHC